MSRLRAAFAGPDRVAAMLVVGITIVAIALILVSTRNTRGETSGTPASASSSAPPRCADLDIPWQPRERVTCRTASAVLTIAAPREPVLVEDTQIRVLRATLRADEISVRLRVRNETGQRRRVNVNARQFHLRIGGTRRSARPVDSPVLASGSSRTLSLRFAVDSVEVQRIRRGSGHAELAVRSFSQVNARRPSRLGVVRLLLEKPPQRRRPAATTATQAPEPQAPPPAATTAAP